MSFFQTILKTFGKGQGTKQEDQLSETVQCLQPLKLLTLNACLFPYMMSPSFHSTNKKQRLPLIVDFLVEQSAQGYDVVCLQEVFSSLFSSFYKDEILSDSRIQKAFPYVFQSPLVGFCQHKKVVDSGLLILSKYPMSKKSFVQFNDNHGWMMPCLKGFMICEINFNDNPIVIVNTHLQPDCSSLIKKKKYERIRYAQCSQIRDRLWDILGSAGFYETSIVITGDFNVHRESEEFASIQRALVCDEASRHDKIVTINTSLPFSKHYKEETLDYAVGQNIYFKETITMTDRKSLSDHFPVGFHIFN
jgi:endonuclease/exonuclease/phosphatase family metal-dependent hydrolase